MGVFTCCRGKQDADDGHAKVERGAHRNCKVPSVDSNVSGRSSVGAIAMAQDSRPGSFATDFTVRSSSSFQTVESRGRQATAPLQECDDSGPSAASRLAKLRRLSSIVAGMHTRREQGKLVFCSAMLRPAQGGSGGRLFRVAPCVGAGRRCGPSVTMRTHAVKSWSPWLRVVLAGEPWRPLSSPMFRHTSEVTMLDRPLPFQTAATQHGCALMPMLEQEHHEQAHAKLRGMTTSTCTWYEPTPVLEACGHFALASPLSPTMHRQQGAAWDPNQKQATPRATYTLAAARDGAAPGHSPRASAGPQSAAGPSSAAKGSRLRAVARFKGQGGLSKMTTALPRTSTSTSKGPGADEPSAGVDEHRTNRLYHYPADPSTEAAAAAASGGADHLVGSRTTQPSIYSDVCVQEHGAQLWGI